MGVYIAAGYGAKAILDSRPAAARRIGVLMVVIGALLVVHQLWDIH